MRFWSNPADFFRRRRNPAAEYRVVGVDPATNAELLSVYFIASSALEAENKAVMDFGKRGLMFAGYKGQKPTGPASVDLYLYFRPMPVAAPPTPAAPSSKAVAKDLLRDFRSAADYVFMRTPRAAEVLSILEAPTTSYEVVYATVQVEQALLTHVRSVVTSADWYFKALRPRARRLFLYLIKSFDLSAKDRAAIEQVARYWDKKSVGVLFPESGNARCLQEYVKTHTALVRQALLAESIIAKSSERKTISVGDFRIINAGGFDEVAVGRVVSLIEKVVTAMNRIGLSRVCYGPVILSNQLRRSKKVSAFYEIANDEMYVRTGILDDAETIQTVCHELGHRLQSKILSKNTEIEDLFKTLKRAERKAYPEVGKEYAARMIRDPSVRAVYKVLAAGKRRVKISATPMGLAPPQFWTLSLESFWSKVEPRTSALYFISDYASTDAAENFCEMIGYHALGVLPANQIALLETILQ